MRNRLHSHPELLSINKKTIEYEVFYSNETDSVRIRANSHADIKKLIGDYSDIIDKPLIIRRGANEVVMPLDQYHEYVEKKEFTESSNRGKTLDCKFIENDIPEYSAFKV